MAKLTFSDADVRIISEKLVYEGFFRIKQVEVQYQQFAGGWGAPHQLEVFDRSPVAAVLPYDPKRDEIVLIEEFRVGCLGDPEPWLLEIVAGAIEEGESPEQMAHRELKEEAGLTTNKLHKIHEYWTSPGGSSEYLTLFCAEVDATQAGGIHGAPNEHEDIKVHTLSYQKAMERIASGNIRNAATILALQWLALNKDTFE